MFENSSRRFKAQQADFFRKLCLFQLEINCALTIQPTVGMKMGKRATCSGIIRMEQWDWMTLVTMEAIIDCKNKIEEYMK